MRYLLSSLLMLSLLTACVAPQLVVRLHPVQPPTAWQYGKQLLKQQRNQLEAWFNFEEARNQQLLFYVQITNFSADTVLISPEEFWVAYYGADTNSYMGKASLLDPELQILELEKVYSRHAARAANQAGRNTLVVLSAAVAEIAEPVDDGIDQTDEEIASGQDDAAYNAALAGGIEDNISFWKDQTLRKTSLAPNQSIEGLLLFPDMAEARRLRFILPAGRNQFQFNYKKEVHQP